MIKIIVIDPTTPPINPSRKDEFSEIMHMETKWDLGNIKFLFTVVQRCKNTFIRFCGYSGWFGWKRKSEKKENKFQSLQFWI